MKCTIVDFPSTLKGVTIRLAQSYVDAVFGPSRSCCRVKAVNPHQKLKNMGLFRHGSSRFGKTREVVINKNQNSHLVKPLLEDNCWVAVPPGVDLIGQGDSGETFDFILLR